jgi:hypothetical protein
MSTSSVKVSLTRTKLLIDVAIFAGFLMAMDPRSTGIAIHEWLSIALAAAIITHLLLNWRWIVEVSRRFLGKVANRARVNYILNFLLFVDITLCIFTGIMISQVALPLLGITLPMNFLWRRLHDLTAEGLLYLIGLHIALHWGWIVRTVKRLLVRPMITHIRPARRVEQKEVKA